MAEKGATGRGFGPPTKDVAGRRFACVRRRTADEEGERKRGKAKRSYGTGISPTHVAAAGDDAQQEARQQGSRRDEGEGGRDEEEGAGDGRKGQDEERRGAGRKTKRKRRRNALAMGREWEMRWRGTTMGHSLKIPLSPPGVKLIPL